MRIENKKQSEEYREATRLSTKILRELANSLEIGKYPKDIDDYCRKLCKKYNVSPAFEGVEMNGSVFPASCNVNVNDEVLHAIPSKKRAFQKGDIIKIDFGLIKNGYYTDQCYTFVLGEYKDPVDERLVNTAKLATEEALKRAIHGNKTGDLGNVMWSIANLSGFDVLKNYVGHGVGNSLHEYPPVPAYGEPGTGHKLEDGMVFCVESQIVAGTDETFITDDEWTVKTKDGKNSAMFEYIVCVGKKKAEIFTDMFDWPILIK